MTSYLDAVAALDLAYRTAFAHAYVKILSTEPGIEDVDYQELTPDPDSSGLPVPELLSPIKK